MYYCFLKEDIEQLTYDPLIIQKEYAMRLGSLYVGSLEQQTIYDASGTKVSIADKRVLLHLIPEDSIGQLGAHRRDPILGQESFLRIIGPDHHVDVRVMPFVMESGIPVKVIERYLH